jgi:xanthine/uracil permease
MRATQGALIAGSAVNIVLGFSGLWSIAARFVSPIVIAPVTTIVGLGLLEYGFPGIGKCVEIGIPALLIILFISQVSHSVCSLLTTLRSLWSLL